MPEKYKIKCEILNKILEFKLSFSHQNYSNLFEKSEGLVTGDFSSIFIVKMIKMVLTISVEPSLAAFKNLFCRSCIGLSL